MAALAYLLLPVSGLIAYMKGRTVRVRWHGLQAITLGVAWPAALYVCSWVSPGATQGAFIAGAGAWVVLMVAAAAGREVGVPGLKGVLERAARRPPGTRS